MRIHWKSNGNAETQENSDYTSFPVDKNIITHFASLEMEGCSTDTQCIEAKYDDSNSRLHQCSHILPHNMIYLLCDTWLKCYEIEENIITYQPDGRT